MEDSKEQLPLTGYPRPHLSPGTPEQLEALADGYFRLTWIMIISFLILWAGGYGAPSLAPPELFVITFFAVQIIIGIGTGLIAYPSMRKIAFGLGRAPWTATANAIAVGVTTPLFVSLVPFVAVLMAAALRIFKFGVRRNIFWYFTMRDVRQVAAEMRAAQVPPAVDNSLNLPHQEI